MGIVNTYRKISNLWGSIAFAVVGLIIAAIAGIAYFTPEPETATVDATIVAIDSDGVGDDKHYFVTVAYTVDGEDYRRYLGAYDSKWRVGDVIECKYQIGEPENISYGNGQLTALIVLIAGSAALVGGIYFTVKNAKRSEDDFAQYDRVQTVDPEKQAEIAANDEEMQEYVFHFCGKLNQDYVMKDQFGAERFYAECGGIRLVKDTDYTFTDRETGERIARKIGHTVTTTVSNSALPFPSVASAFRIDGQSCWDVLAGMGYGFAFTPQGLKVHYDVKHYGVPVGEIALAGTEIMNDKYKDNPLAKIPTAGLYRITCRPSEAAGFFLICFCLSRTELTAA